MIADIAVASRAELVEEVRRLQGLIEDAMRTQEHSASGMCPWCRKPCAEGSAIEGDLHELSCDAFFGYGAIR